MCFGVVAMAAPSPASSSVSGNSVVVTVISETPHTTPASTTSPVAVQAAAENMTVEEFVNNTVASVPGVEDAIPVGVPSGAIINGVKANYSILMTKSTKAVAAEAATLGKKVLNVFALRNKPAGEVQISLYSPKVVAGQKISVYQKIDGKWVLCKSSVRAEHIDVILVGNGPVAVVLN